MRSLTSRLRAAATAGVVGVTAAAGLAALTIPAHADASFSFTRLAGTDRFATAGAIDQAAYPSGESSAFLADGLPAHAPDALAASGLEGIDGYGVLLTDGSNTVPSSTITALRNNKVSTIGVLGGTNSVSQAQIDQLKADGFTVLVPFQGATRYQTMQKIDDSITPSSVGTDAAGNPTAILASGDPAHYVDALSAGALAYAKKFPIILTNSTSSTLQAEAQQVITYLGIKDLIVVGGTSSIPASQYSPKPSGVTQVEVEYGSDRSATAKVLADYAVGQSWLKNSHLDLARGDDGSDALAGAAFGGVNGFATVITDSTTSDGSAPDFATEHASTLTGTSYIFGGTDAVPANQASDVANAAGTAKPASAGSISPTSGQQVNAVSATNFSQGGLSYKYGSGDTYQVDQTTPPNPSPTCTSTTYAIFQASLTQGDTVSGTYSTTGPSTFCLNDQAPNPPTGAKATQNTTAGGVTITWSSPSTAVGDGVNAYEIWRASATASQIPGAPETCPAAYTVSPGSSPQTAPLGSSGWSTLTTVQSSSSTSGSYTYSDPVTTGTGSTANEYCYAISSIAAAGSGGNQTGTASPANADPVQAADPDPVTPGTPTAPAITSVAGLGNAISVTYNEAINPGTVASDGSNYDLTGITYATGVPKTVNAWVPSGGSGNVVILDIDFGTVSTINAGISVTEEAGNPGNTSANTTSVCPAGVTTNCAKTPGSAVTGTDTAAASGANPAIRLVAGSFSGQTVTVNYTQPVDCASIDSSGAQYTVSESGGGSPAASLTPSKAACPSGVSGTSTSVVLTVTGLVNSASITVKYDPKGTGASFASNYGLVSSATGGVAPDPDTGSGTVGS